ncbi:MAG: hypothetical protein JO151_18925 [Verrucomicrobia bacterium]|nr:hypothetical protein [Verrucomicrobiota bacterium]
MSKAEFEQKKEAKPERGNAVRRRMPKGGYFFDAIIRQQPIDEERLNWEDNTEEFRPISDQDLGAIRVAVIEASKTGAPSS